jgi:DNA invertase Pin-like site-specific DNA recombinase
MSTPPEKRFVANHSIMLTLISFMRSMNSSNQIFAAVAELERESIRERQNEEIAAAKKRGTELGRPARVLSAEFKRNTQNSAKIVVTALSFYVVYLKRKKAYSSIW